MKQAAELGEWIATAKYLQSGNIEDWKSLPREVIQHVLIGAIKWTEGEGRNISVQAPGVVTQANSLLGYMRLSLSQVLFWSLAGVLTDEVKAAPDRRHI